jgi:hypothetical protein
VKPWERDGPPKTVFLVHTNRGWSHSMWTTNGGHLLGRAGMIPRDASPIEAMRLLDDIVARAGLEYYDLDLTIVWSEPERSETWTGDVEERHP